MMGFSLGALLVGVALLVLVGIVVASPVLRRSGRSTVIGDPPTPEEEVSPTVRRMQVLLALRDLEFDYATGKVNEEDYHTLRSQLLLEAASVLEMDGAKETPDDASEMPTDLDTLIEQAVQAKRGRRCPHCHHRVQPGDKFCAMCGQPLSHQKTCPECGTTVVEGARFCTACGQALTPVREATL